MVQLNLEGIKHVLPVFLFILCFFPPLFVRNDLLLWVLFILFSFFGIFTEVYEPCPGVIFAEQLIPVR